MEKFDWRCPIRINLLLLRSVGLWPRGYGVYKRNYYLFYSIFTTITIVGGHNLSQVINIFYVYSDLEALTGTIFVATTNILALVKRYVFVRNLPLIKEILQTLNTYQFHPKTRQQLKIIQAPLRRWKLAYLCFSIIVYFNVAMWTLEPLLDKMIKNRRLPFEAWYPFNSKQSPNYEIAYCYQFICIWNITIANLNLDTLIFAFMMFISAQCEILCDDLRSLDVGFGPKLIQCIKHHKEILRLAKVTNNIFNFIILGQIATSTAALALTMFQLSLISSINTTALTHFAYMMGMLSEILLYCWFGNEIEVKSYLIPNAAYESQWMHQDRSVAKNLLILGCRCRKPIKITAINLFTLSLPTFIAATRMFRSLLTNKIMLILMV
nr:PREDICTED: odorant receptor 94a isoform X1 [Tribolium castaneum]|eukprot:XP_015833429.1 PREDICTED: odorant receptor 94a isoform X1 [Tribolium castaneum]